MLIAFICDLKFNLDKFLLFAQEYIRKKYEPPSLEKDAKFVSKNNFKLIVVIETPSKAFSDWSFPKVCQLYGLGESG